jgi:hypothetical protein
MIKKLSVQAMALGFALAVSAGAQASFLSGQLTPNTLNIFEDNSREAAVDVNRNGLFDVGDVLIGFIRIDLKSSPNTATYDNQIYAIFSQQMTGQVACTSGGNCQTFAATTVAGLRLSDIVAGADPNGIAAVYSGGPISDLIATAPGGFLTDYFNVIKTMTLDLVAGIGGAGTNADGADFLTARAEVPANFGAAGAGCANFLSMLCLTGTDTVASYAAGLSILQTFGGTSAFTFADNVSSINFANLALSGPRFQLSISGGNATGGSGDPNMASWGDVSNLGNFAQCGFANNEPGFLPCGFIDNADFGIRPLAVPEPATLILLGSGLAVAAYGLRKSRKPKV